MKILAVLLALVLLLSSVSLVYGAKREATGSLELDLVRSSLSYQGLVYFNWQAEDYKRFEYPMILVACSQPDNPYRYISIVDHPNWVYAQLDHPYAGFLLGGGSSAWVQWVNEDITDAARKIASCEAILYTYPKFKSGSNTITELDRIEFNISYE